MPTSRRQREQRQIRYSSAKQRVEDHEKGFVPTSYTIPEGMELFRFSEVKTYKLVLVPHIVGDHNPYKESGEAHYECTYWVHPRIGPNKDYFPCNRKNKKTACACCDEQNTRASNPDHDRKDRSLWPQERQLWLVIDMDDDDEKVRLFDAAHYGGRGNMGFGEGLDEEIKALEEDDPRLNFFHLEGGCVLHVRTKEAEFDGKKFCKPVKIDIVPRKKDYDESILDDMPCLDELVLEADYATVEKALQGIVQEGESKKEDSPKKDKPSRNGKASARAEEEEESEPEEEEQEEESRDDPTAEEKGIEVGSVVMHKAKSKKDSFGECVVVHVSGDGTSLRLKDEDDEVHCGVNPAECEVIEDSDDDEPEEEEEPAPKKRTTTAKKPKDEEPEDDIPFDDDNEPAPRPKTGRR